MVQADNLLKHKEIHHYFLNKYESSEDQTYREFYTKSIICRQSHSNRVAVINNISDGQIKADAMITLQKINLCVVTADCLPVLFYESKLRIIAAVHAGWQGLENGIIKETLLKFQQLGGKPQNILSGIGPHIRPCCYNVDYHRVMKFAKLGFPVKLITKKITDIWHLDLGKIAQLSMIKFGMNPANIDCVTDCTSCSQEYFSYRRDKAKTGRMYSLIGFVS